MRWVEFRRFVPLLAILGVIALFFSLRRCSSPRSVNVIEGPPAASEPVTHSGEPETTTVVAPVETASVNPVRSKNVADGNGRGASRRTPTVPTTTPSNQTSQPRPDSVPYVYADPWGGRHFDSVTVDLHCQEDCPILYSLEDSVNLHPYRGSLTFRSNATLWFTGVSSRGYRAPIVQLDYVIEKNPRFCPDGGMPVAIRGHEICVDIYEWPNQENARPSVMVNHEQAMDSCDRVGKHLCTLEEWQSACEGPEQSRYPYGESYDERYCPAQQSGPSYSGRFPACRSYYGVFDLAGSVWEWTSTVDPNHKNFYFVAGGNWSSADNAMCGMAKYSFYPQNRYPSVGFRCCAEVK